MVLLIEHAVGIDVYVIAKVLSQIESDGIRIPGHRRLGNGIHHAARAAARDQDRVRALDDLDAVDVKRRDRHCCSLTSRK